MGNAAGRFPWCSPRPFQVFLLVGEEESPSVNVSYERQLRVEGYPKSPEDRSSRRHGTQDPVVLRQAGKEPPT
jgi:hypothetical protein